MDPQEYIQHWNYYCSLAARFDGTKDYLYHGFCQNEDDRALMIHGDVYSDIFKQIIILSASEFEIISQRGKGEEYQKHYKYPSKTLS